MSATWEPPFVLPHVIGCANKFGRRTANSSTRGEVEGQAVDALTRRYGSPLFIVSERRLRENARRLRAAFERHWPDVVHGWSYKTNYTAAVCNILHQEGCWAEVVSRFEYEKARHLGVPGERILFNGPNKPRAALERAVAEGAHVHVDHFDELALLESVAAGQGRRVPMTLRLSFDTGYSEPWSRFGFDMDTGEAREAAARVQASPHLALTGLHNHLGTFMLEPSAYAAQARRLTGFMRRLEADGGTRIETLDIGGGFPSRNALQGVYAPPEQTVPEVEEYAEAACSSLRQGLAGRPGPWPTLVFESGRAAVDDAEFLATTVVGTKRLPDGRHAGILDAGVNLMLTAFWYNHPVKLVAQKQGQPRETVLYGPLCMNIDVMRHSVQLPPLEAGDQLLFGPVGAYNNTQWMQFIEYRPAIVLLHADGGHSVIREAEDLESMCRHDRLPPHLRQAGFAPAAALVAE